MWIKQGMDKEGDYETLLKKKNACIVISVGTLKKTYTLQTRLISSADLHMTCPGELVSVWRYSCA